MKSIKESAVKEITIEQFKESLNQWGESELSLDETNLENIEEAKRRILEAYKDYLDYKANPRNNGYSSFRSLDLSNLCLNSLPDAIFQIEDLYSLDIGNNDWSGRNKNKISGISPLIANLKKLQILTFNDNQISTLPDKIGELTELKELRGQHNHLTSLPESIEKLTKLESVFLPNNQITKIPSGIKECKQLKHLTLNNNYLDDLSLYHASQSGTQEVKRYLEIYGNPNLLIDPRIYYQCYGGKISDFNMNAEYPNHFNKYHLHFLLNNLLLNNKLAGNWFFNKMIL
jgi:Leucine-rich repeat (LRR) protein